MVVREETAKGQKERKIPVTRNVLGALGAYREAFGLSTLPAPDDTGQEALDLIRSTNAKVPGMVATDGYLVPSQ